MAKYQSIDVHGTLKKPYHWVFSPKSEDGKWKGVVSEFPGCEAWGESLYDVAHKLHNTAYSWVKANLLRGAKIPEPIAPKRRQSTTNPQVVATLELERLSAAQLDAQS